MSEMSIFFSRLKKTSKKFPIEKVNEKWKFRFGVLEKTSKIFPMKKSMKIENFAKTTKDFPIKKCEFALY